VLQNVKLSKFTTIVVKW